jgi:UDP-N-acetylglucosamine 2-epimerase (non-hydrolysing)
MKKITLIAGARPNFIKIAPIIHAIQARQNEGSTIIFRLVHTGQHYDKKMSGSFFEDLNIPDPDANLGAGGGTQAEQTANIMIGFEKDLLANPCDLVLVVGDVTSTMACSLVAQKLNTKVAHVEAGIRSGDWTMPEEINRLVTDSISNYFFTTTQEATNTLIKEGKDPSMIYFVGNTMIDTLVKNRPNFIQPKLWIENGLAKRNYLVMTLHRPANVDEDNKVGEYIKTILDNTEDLKIVFPVHPRTAQKLNEMGIEHPRLICSEPMGYLEFNYLVENAKAVITDSGGITEETTVMGVPCITLRDNTERPETITQGTNELIGTEAENLIEPLQNIISNSWKKGSIPDLWDGNTSSRIIKLLESII